MKLSSLASTDPARDLSVSSPQVHVAMLGARQHYAKAKILESAGILWRLYTDIYADHWWGVARVFRTIPSRLRPRWMERFLGRSDSQLPAHKVRSFNILGLWYLWQVRRAPDARALNRVYLKAAQSFNRRIIAHGECEHAGVILGFDGAAVELFQYAKKRRIPCILEQTIAPQDIVNTLLSQECARWPEWEPRLDFGTDDGTFIKRQEKEWQLADAVLGASSFVIDSLREHGVPAATCRLVPYGIPLDRFVPGDRALRRSSDRLHVLFVGEIALRKGVPYLLEALRLLNSPHIEVKLAGAMSLSPARLAPYDKFATFLGKVPRNMVMGLYQWADVFVLPSICEGSALVAYEALASGVPVIATPNSGTPVENGTDGVLVPMRDVDALAQAIERFCHDKTFLAFCRQNALEGRERLGLEAYRRRLIHVFMDVAARRH